MQAGGVELYLGRAKYVKMEEHFRNVPTWNPLNPKYVCNRVYLSFCTISMSAVVH